MADAQDIVIVGAGGFGREVRQWVEDRNRASSTFRVVGFLDGDASKHGTVIHGVTVLGDLDWLDAHREVGVVLGVGHPHVKHRIVARLGGRVAFPSVVHPRACVGANVQLGEGTIVCPDVILTTDIAIGRWVTLNLAVTVGHDGTIGDFSTLAPGANLSGYTTLGEGVDLGTGVATVPAARIGAWSIVGAGAVVTGELPADCTAVGMPARAIKQRAPGWHRALPQ